MTIRSVVHRPFLSGAIVGCALGLMPGHSKAQEEGPSRQDCLTLHEKAQELRKQSKLLETRKVLRTCSNEACPGLVRGDCVDWLAEVERAIPTVVFEVVLSGHDVPNAKITEGDRPLKETINGTPVELDAGVHQFKAEIPGHSPIETTVVTREGEKARVIRFDFTPPPPITPPLVPGPENGARPVPTSVYVSGALAVATLAAGTTFGVIAFQKRNQLTCSPLCTSSELSPVRTAALLSDIFFGGAIVSVGVATVFLLTRPVVPTKETPKTGVALEATPLVGPGLQGLGLRGSF
jgi:hypothetical protein